MHFYTLNTATGEMLQDDKLGQWAKRSDLGARLTIQDNLCKRAISGYDLRNEPMKTTKRTAIA